MQDRPVEAVMTELVTRLREVLGPDLESVVLFGSAAENRLRPTSDVNVIFVLRAFDGSRLASAAGALRGAAAAIRLAPMFILAEEIPAAAQAFSVKFADIARRRRVLFGPDPFAHLTIDRGAQLRRLGQVLINLVFRLRSALALHGDEPARLSALVADAAAPLRAAAGSYRDLAGKPPVPPREALAEWAAELGFRDAASLLSRISKAREDGTLPPGDARPAVLGMLELAEQMRKRAAALHEERVP
jgi:hypothetical protein